MTITHTPETPVYNSRIVLSFLRLLGRQYPHIDSAQLLDYAGITLAEVEDPGKWFSQKEINRFSEKLLELSGKPSIFREAGRGILNEAGFGTQYVLSTVGPARTLQLTTALARKYSRSCLYRSRQLDAHRVEISVIPYPGTEEIPVQCHNRIGSFEAVFSLFNYEAPTIEHPECMFDGGSECRYVISWTEGASFRAKKWGTAVWAAFSVPLAVAAMSIDSAVPLALLGGWVVVYLAFLLYWARKDRQNVAQLLDRSRESFGELESSTSTLHAERLAADLGTVISGEEGVIARVVELLRQSVRCGSCGVFLAEEAGDVLRWRGGVGFPEEVVRMIEQAPPRTTTENETGDPVGACFMSRMPVTVGPAGADGSVLPGWLKALGPGRAVCCPITGEMQPLGVLFAGSCPGRPAFVETDLNILRGLAPVLGMSLLNARLMKEKQERLDAGLKLDEAMARLHAVRKETAALRRERAHLMSEMEALSTGRSSHGALTAMERDVTSLEQSVAVLSAMLHRVADSDGEKDTRALQRQVAVMEECAAGMRRSISSFIPAETAP